MIGAQRLVDGSGAASVAEVGTRGAGGALPHLDTIQRSFGRHDVSGVRSHVGGAAADASGALDASAFAHGDAVGSHPRPICTRPRTRPRTSSSSAAACSSPAASTVA